jgi:hypothetical protein
MAQTDAYRMIGRRTRAAGIKSKTGNPLLRATGIKVCRISPHANLPSPHGSMRI